MPNLRRCLGVQIPPQEVFGCIGCNHFLPKNPLQIKTREFLPPKTDSSHLSGRAPKGNSSWNTPQCFRCELLVSGTVPTNTLRTIHPPPSKGLPYLCNSSVSRPSKGKRALLRGPWESQHSEGFKICWKLRELLVLGCEITIHQV